MINKKTSAIIFILLVCAASVYFFNGPMSNHDECKQISGKLNSQTCAKLIYTNLSGAHFLMMNYPATAHHILLNKTKTIAGDKYLQGHYQFVLKKAKGNDKAVYDSGSLHLNMSKMQLLTENKNQLIYFVAPFVINTQGSGEFIYVGLFSYDISTHKSRHLDSFFLGDRIQKEKIQPFKDYIKIDYKDYAQDQAFSDPPSKTVSVLLLIENINAPQKTPHFKKIKQSSLGQKF